MEVYVLMTGEYESEGVRGIFSTEQKARACIATFGQYQKWSLERYTVDDPDGLPVYLGDEDNPTLTPRSDSAP
jgi:hypothetical protein